MRQLRHGALQLFSRFILTCSKSLDTCIESVLRVSLPFSFSLSAEVSSTFSFSKGFLFSKGALNGGRILNVEMKSINASSVFFTLIFQPRVSCFAQHVLRSRSLERIS